MIDTDKFNENLSKANESLEELKVLLRKLSEVKEIDSDGNTINEVIAMQQELNLLYKDMDSIKSAFYSTVNAFRLHKSVEIMEDQGLTSMKVENVGTATLMDDISTSVLDADKLASWLIEEGHDSLIKETVNSSSLKALIRRLMKEGQSTPKDDIVKVTPYTYVKVV